MQALMRNLVDHFSGQRLSVAKVYELHNEPTQFTMANYREALRRLAYNERIATVEREEGRPVSEATVRNRHMAEYYVITFPSTTLPGAERPSAADLVVV